MPDTEPDIYWDANPFLSYVNGHPDRLPTLDALLDKSSSGALKLYTSALSQVEVAFAASEQKRGSLNPEEGQKIASLWSDPRVVEIVEYHDGIGRQARALMRDAITRGWSLKPMDAIHLATAQWLLDNGYAVAEFHTHDRSLDKYGPIVGFRISEPHIIQPGLLYHYLPPRSRRPPTPPPPPPALAHSHARRSRRVMVTVRRSPPWERSDASRTVAPWTSAAPASALFHGAAARRRQTPVWAILQVLLQLSRPSLCPTDCPACRASATYKLQVQVRKFYAIWAVHGPTDSP